MRCWTGESGGSSRMICERCHKEITFNEWAHGFCLDRGWPARHVADPNIVRESYWSMLREMEYARNQP